MKIHHRQLPILMQSLTLFFSMLFVGQALADLILAAPPRESLKNGRSVYNPIAKGIEKLIGEKVIYQQPRNWFDYSIKMRSGAYDIIFDGPHFAAWRIVNSDHIPVAALPGKLKFFLITDINNDPINNLIDISKLVMCGMPAPNLGTGMIMAEYSNPNKQPMIYESRSFTNAYKNFNAGECHAVVLRDKVYSKLSRDEKSSIKIIFMSEALPNQTVTIGPNLTIYASKIRRFLTSSGGRKVAKNLLDRFSKNNPKFIRARKRSYYGLEKYLQGRNSKW